MKPDSYITLYTKSITSDGQTLSQRDKTIQLSGKKKEYLE